MKNALFFALFLLLATACKKTPDISCESPTNEVNASRKLIKGTWIWKSERYFTRGMQQVLIKTPETEGYTRKIVIGDSTITYYKNDSVGATEHYGIDAQSKATKYELDVNTVLLFKSNKTKTYYQFTPFKVCNDSLFLKWLVVSDVRGNETWYKK